MKCGHCVAVCSTGSVAIEGFEPSAFRELEEHTISDRQVLTLLRQRRSVRRYKDKAVPSDLLARVVEAAHAAPTGTGRPSTSLVILSDRSVIEKIPPIINRSSVLRQMLSIPEPNEAYTAVTLGLPKYKWRRSVPHRLAEVRYL